MFVSWGLYHGVCIMYDRNEILEGLTPDHMREISLSIGCTLSPDNRKNVDTNFGTDIGFFVDSKGLGRYKDFSTGEGGTFIDFVCRVKGVDFKEGLDYLGRYLELPQTLNPIRPKEPRRDKIKGVNDELRDEILSTFSKYCQKRLDETTKGVEYLTGRGISREVTYRQGIGFIRNFRRISDYLKSKFKVSDLRQVGLFSRGDRLIFGVNRVVFPFYQGDRVVYIQTRGITPESKYIQLGIGIPCLYNVNCLEGADRVTICEGVIDTLTLISKGYNAVGVLGVNNFKSEWVSLFEGKEVLVCFDNDRAGRQGLKDLYKQGLRFKEIKLPRGVKDVNEYFTKGGQ